MHLGNIKSLFHASISDDDEEIEFNSEVRRDAHMFVSPFGNTTKRR
jgi:hypothetical protein